MTLDDIYIKLMRYCAYQERCPFEIRKKTTAFEVSEEETQKLINRLIEENFIDLNRYASAYARGKFHQNKWGKIKIEHGLKQKEIDDRHIAFGISEISQKEYLETIAQLVKQKWESVFAKNDFEKQQKTALYMSNKGYEADLFWKAIKKISG